MGLFGKFPYPSPGILAMSEANTTEISNFWKCWLIILFIYDKKIFLKRNRMRQSVSGKRRKLFYNITSSLPMGFPPDSHWYLTIRGEFPTSLPSFV